MLGQRASAPSCPLQGAEPPAMCDESKHVGLPGPGCLSMHPTLHPANAHRNSVVQDMAAVPCHHGAPQQDQQFICAVRVVFYTAGCQQG